jgi:hypothetical protein
VHRVSGRKTSGLHLDHGVAVECSYGVVELRELSGYDWRLAEGNVWKVEQMLIDWPHRRIKSSNQRIAAMRRRYVAFREAHGYKPWRYYKGRERWAPLPPEFRYRG